MDLVDYELIKGSWTPEELSGDVLETYDYRVIYQGWTGSSWQTIAFIDGTLAGQTAGSTWPFTFQDKTGYTKFRMTITDRNSSGGNWRFSSYSSQQNKSETVINQRGASFIGGVLYFVDMPRSDSGNYRVSDLKSNSIFSDEKDGNGNWILKQKA